MGKLRDNARDPEKTILLLSYLDYAFPSGLSRRIEGILTVLKNTGFRAKVLAPLFRLTEPNDHDLPEEVTTVDLQFLNRLGPERISTKILANFLFTMFVMFYVLVNRRRLNLIQYESIFSFPAGLLAKIVSGLRCIGDDLLPATDHFLMSKAYLIAGLLSDAVMVSVPHEELNFPEFLANKTILFPSGVGRVDFKNHRSTDKLTLPDTAVFVGAPSYKTNQIAVRHILEVSQHLPSDIELQFIVVGGFRNENPARTNRVVFVGRVSDNKLRLIYSDAYLGLLPFFGTVAEGLKVKALEFFSVGLLVVSSNEGVKGIKGLIPYHHYVPANSMDELIDRLVESVKDPKKSRSIAAKGQRFVLENYSWYTVSKEYLRLIRVMTQN